MNVSLLKDKEKLEWLLIAHEVPDRYERIKRHIRNYAKARKAEGVSGLDMAAATLQAGGTAYPDDLSYQEGYWRFMLQRSNDYRDFYSRVRASWDAEALEEDRIKQEKRRLKNAS